MGAILYKPLLEGDCSKPKALVKYQGVIPTSAV
jgi:hypothetical protein